MFLRLCSPDLDLAPHLPKGIVGNADGAGFGDAFKPGGDIDIAERTGSLDPTTYRDRYQEALRELLEAKMKGPPLNPGRSRPRHPSSISWPP
jgi:hypothetical protein